MSEDQPGQFGVRLSDGMRIDRLPIGLAAGHWWIQFIFSGVDFEAGSRPRRERMWHEARELVHMDGEHGRFGLAPDAAGSSGFDGEIYWVQYRFPIDELPRLEVSYLEDGAVVASESLDLR